MSFVGSPLFDDLAPWIKVQTYDRDGSARNPRVRIELAGDTPLQLLVDALQHHTQCAACGDLISPFRHRKTGGRHPTAGAVYYAPTCPLKVNVGCSRGAAASDAYLRLRAALREHRGEPGPDDQQSLDL